MLWNNVARDWRSARMAPGPMLLDTGAVRAWLGAKLRETRAVRARFVRKKVAGDWRSARMVPGTMLLETGAVRAWFPLGDAYRQSLLLAVYLDDDAMFLHYAALLCKL